MRVTSFVLAASLAFSAGAAERPAVVVLYFDNNTGQPELDVLQKGFADMMVTDLSAVEGVQVVEREKLEKLLAELKLQRTGFFDPATAQKLGKGVGAQYAVAGAFAAIEPAIRIDARLIEISSGKVMLADKVTGEKKALFSLQQELVAKLADAMHAKLGLADTGRKTRVPDVDTLVAYSKSIDLADQGRLEEASKAMSEVVKRAPAFGLAREKRDELLKKVKEAGVRRKDLLDADAQELAKSAKAMLSTKKLDALDEAGARTFLAYRMLEARLLARTLKPHLSRNEGTRVVLRGHEARALELMRAIAASMRSLIGEVERFSKRYTKQVAAVAFLDTALPLPYEDQRRARETGFGAPALGKPLKLPLAEFLLLGTFDDVQNSRLTVAPSLSDRDSRAADEGFALLEGAFVEADAQAQKQPHLEYGAIQVLDTHAEALLRKGRSEEAIGKWQKILDTYPASTQFGRFERRIKDELGLGANAMKKDTLAYPIAARTCDEMGVAKALPTVLYQRVLTAGPDGVRQVIAELEQSCKASPKMKQRWPSVYAAAGIHAAGIEDCETFRQMFDRYVEAGGPATDRDAYLKNYGGVCAP